MKTTSGPTLSVVDRLSGARSALTLFATTSAFVYGLIVWLSFRFQVDTRSEALPPEERPLIAVLLLFACAFFLYAFSIRVVRRANDRAGLMKQIVGFAILFRLIMWFSNPIQEVDIYRYLWDGVVCTQGISPFRFSPEEVLIAIDQPPSDPDLDRLVAVCQYDPGIAETLRRVHIQYLPTVYPPVSQAVFTIAAWTTPSGASPLARMRVMKLWLLLFDLATLWVVVRLLLLCRLPTELCIAYAWCPLLMKEVANSGHLDSIAVFLTTGAFYVFVKTLRTATVSDSHSRAPTPTKGLLAASVLLALAVGAKIYPIVLVPLFAWVVYRRFGLRAVIAPAATFALMAMLLLSPFMPRSGIATGSDPSKGMATFLRSWEMNDFLFMLVVENLKPQETEAASTAWFSIMPAETREQIVGASSSLGIPPGERPFFVTRLITGMVFLAVAIGLARGRAHDEIVDSSLGVWDSRTRRLCETGFLTIAWFWLLCPTQNPWYWTWALPLLPFMRNRAWYAVSGLVFLYYTRFWFEYYREGIETMGTGYTGTLFFDFVVTWIEFAPWLVWLAISGWQSERFRHLS